MSKSLCIFLLLCFILTINATCQNSQYSEYVFNLAGYNLKFPCKSTKSIYVQTGRYIPKNVITTRGQIYKDKIFVVMSRYLSGIPFTLGQVKLKKNHYQTEILPYPSWDIQEEGNCDALQSVVDIYLDKQGILWILDTGICNSLQQPIRRCSPKILAIKISNDKLIKKIDLSNLILAESRLQFIVTEYASGKPYVYVSDAQTGSVIVYNVQADKGHRIILPSTCKSSNKDVLYIALAKSQQPKENHFKDNQSHSQSSSSSPSVSDLESPKFKNEHCKLIEKHSVPLISLYFTYLESKNLYAIETKHLRSGAGSGAIIDCGPKPNSLPMVLLGSQQNDDALYMRYSGQNDIYRYDVKKCFKMANLEEIYKGCECRLTTQVIPGSSDFVWNLESNFPDYINGTTGCNGASVIVQPIYRESN